MTAMPKIGVRPVEGVDTFFSLVLFVIGPIVAGAAYGNARPGSEEALVRFCAGRALLWSHEAEGSDLCRALRGSAFAR